MPNASRPYRALGYPGVPLVFLFVTVALLVNTFFAAPRQALQGVAICSRLALLLVVVAARAVCFGRARLARDAARLV